MFADVAALAIAQAKVQICKRPADHRRTFGCFRFEILGAALNAVLPLIAALYLLQEACQRFFYLPFAATVTLSVQLVGL